MLNALLETIGALGALASIAVKLAAYQAARAPAKRDRGGF
jgi:hypothetical protein